MVDRPILFSGPMVRAILAGTKTQTRRVVKLTGPDVVEERDDGSRWPYSVTWAHGDDGEPWYACPYGEPGDRLWVRETFSPHDGCGTRSTIGQAAYVVLVDGVQVYRDGTIVAGLAEYAPGAFANCKWRPSIHMPRWASRLALDVTSVRVERLHDITEDDARAEGVEREPTRRWRDYMPERESFPTSYLTARDSFCSLWESIHGTSSLAANPWVWVVGFKVRRG